MSSEILEYLYTPKYCLTEDTIEVDGRNLYCIQALKPFAISNDYIVSEGELGGYVESEYNLSQEGNCWVFMHAKVFGDARILDNALISGEAKVYGNAVVSGSAEIDCSAEVFGYAQVSQQSQIGGEVKVSGHSIIQGAAEIN